MPKAGEGQEEPGQERLRGRSNLFEATGTVCLHGHCEQGLEGGRKAPEITKLHPEAAPGLGQTGHGGCKGSRQEGKNTAVHEHVPPQAGHEQHKAGEMDVASAAVYLGNSRMRI